MFACLILVDAALYPRNVSFDVSLRTSTCPKFKAGENASVNTEIRAVKLLHYGALRCSGG